jgi:E3 ubiquitin-protein ligase TRIP12
VLLGTEVALVADGASRRVTADSVSEYVAAVTDHICGARLRPVADAFARGFGNVFQPGAWELLSAEELCAVVSGTGTGGIEMADLIESIELSNGYAPGSPPVQLLFELLLGWDEQMRALFFKFVTGSERLPIGGLAALEPRLTVAKKVGCNDGALPSAMTCTNYFKLPPYTKREEMAEKVGKAIMEGQGEFFFS